MIGLLAAESFPSDTPAFTRTNIAASEISALGPEEDRLKGAGLSWDADNDPAHYLDVADNGTVDGVLLDVLPNTLAEYAKVLAVSGSTPWSRGYLPYAIVDGLEQVRQDFALWRVDSYGAGHAPNLELRARFLAARGLREDLTLRDIGIWSHFVGDGSQPLHVTVHFNGWDDRHRGYFNPRGFTDAPIHALFESDFVDRYVTLEDVRSHLSNGSASETTGPLTQVQLDGIIGAYLAETNSAVVPLYEIAGANGDGFRHYSANAVSFAAAQLARGAAELRRLTELAWRDSWYESVGYPPQSVRAILNGAVPLGGDP